MLTGTLHYTLNHILLLRLMMVFPFEKIKTLHNFLYLAASQSSDCPRPFIFIKLRSGAYSFEIQKVLSEFKRADFLMENENLKLNDQGREIYYSFAHVLKYHKFPQNCLNMAEKYGKNLWQVNHEILFDRKFREKKVGEKIIFQPIL